jgi:polar amino acid transport system permease protein
VNLSLITLNGSFFLHAGFTALIIFVASVFFASTIALFCGPLAALRTAMIRVPVRLIIEFFRDVPQVVSLFFIFFGAPVFGLQLGPLAATILALSLWGGANGAEIVRGGINAVSHHQFESARSLGLAPHVIFTSIILPQAILPVIPAYAGLCNILMHSTSLAALVGVVELLKSAQIVIDRASYYQGGAPGLTIYGFILLVYYVAGLLMSAGISALERRYGSAQSAQRL